MKRFLYNKPGVKNISAILLLLVFTLGIIPKKTLHNWLANHKDTASPIPKGTTQHLSISGFNCNCEDFVAESHFIISNSPAIAEIPSTHSFVLIDIPSFVSSSLFHTSLRGPPLKF